MSASNICHFLIGVPGSGKSTFAASIAKLGNYIIISTDEIRAALYGNAAIQGNWNEVENQAFLLIQQARTSGKNDGEVARHNLRQPIRNQRRLTMVTRKWGYCPK
jgi:predicted kinase